ncbi:MAG: LytTR family DNA-binding domain-containing protein [Cytophagales bacterium]|nr:LytTR family DNA-binding domain-containing protein [Cytophagales bacterium]MDW8384916.1 LytTR family DNA-binding domain-containing protein [Flammeovirgaceae bacterium]
MTCIIVDDDEISRDIVRQMVRKTEGLELIAECKDGIEAYNTLKRESVDMVFLDIDMPDMSGMELVSALNNPSVQYIIITGRRDQAIEAFDLNIADYIVKPAQYSRFIKAVNKVRDNLNKTILDTHNKEDIYVKSDGKIIRIKLKDILFVEALSDYVIIHTNTDKKHIVHSTMKAMEAKLSSNDFVRVHRSFIVNASKIDQIEDMNITIQKKTVPVGASYKNALMERLGII